LVGARLGRYRVGPRLGSGGAASVYLAQLEGPHNFARAVALKVIHEHLLDEKEFVDMFLDEANLAVRLTHPNIVHVYDLGREGNVLFLAMEYLDGQPLSRIVARARQRGMTLPVDLVAYMGARSADGLHHAHELKDETGERIGLVHRDVSPHNIFVTYDGRVKLIDFGIARAEGRLAQTALGQVKGKFAYMAPEQALHATYDRRADLFSLGVTLYEAAVGARMFPDLDRVEALHKILLGDLPDPSERVPDFPGPLGGVIKKLLAAEPDARYQTAAEVATALDECTGPASDPGLEARLGALVTDLFQQERSDGSRSMAELKAGHLDGYTDQTTSAFGISRAEALSLQSKRRPRWILPAVAVGVAGAIAGAWFAVSHHKSGTAESATASTTPRARTVAFEIRLDHAVDEATISVDGRPAVGKPARIELLRSNRPVTIVVDAPGYKEQRLDATPDRDQLLLLSLDPLAPPTPASAAAASPSAGSSSSSSSMAGAPASKTRARTESRETPGSPRLITNYPF
jgi:serine/threonine-protein kinase